MRFNIYYANHVSGVSIEDISTYVRNALRLVGHKAFLSPTLEPVGYNVLIENFTPELAAHIVGLRQNTPARFIIVATEFTDGTTFNPQTAGADMHYGRSDYWHQRFGAFRQVAAVADAVWCMSHYQFEPYRALLDPLPVFEFPRGFDPLMTPPLDVAPDDKDIDLLFSGNFTAYRRDILRRLSQSFVTIAVPAQTPTAARLDLIGRAKACLHINLVENARYNSIGRHHFLLMSKAPIVSERSALPGDLDEFVVEVDSATIVEQIGDYLDGDGWKTQGEEMYERYRTARPIATAVADMVVQSTRALEDA